jgi:hypothetical protein
MHAVDLHEVVQKLKPEIIRYLSSVYASTRVKNKQKRMLLREFQGDLRKLAVALEGLEESDQGHPEVLEMASKMNISGDVVRECCVEAARSIYRHPYVLFHNMNKLELQRNRLELERLVSRAIKSVIRQSLDVATYDVDVDSNDDGSDDGDVDVDPCNTPSEDLEHNTSARVDVDPCEELGGGVQGQANIGQEKHESIDHVPKLISNEPTPKAPTSPKGDNTSEPATTPPHEPGQETKQELKVVYVKDAPQAINAIRNELKAHSLHGGSDSECENDLGSCSQSVSQTIESEEDDNENTFF